MTGPPTRIEPCPPEDWAAALALIYIRMHEGARGRQVADALGAADRGEVDLAGLWVARRKGRLVGAMLTQAMAGRAAAVWAPEVVSGWGRAELAAGLVRAALDDLQARGFRIAQALLDDSAPARAAGDLARGGLPRVAELASMRRRVDAPIAVDPAGPRLDWRPYGPDTDAEFRELLERTYVGSLDMPELDGHRSLDDVLAGHRAAGRFDPGRWQVGRLPGSARASAVLLLSAVPDRTSWEVAYLGLAPEARGRGLGRAILARAVELARPHATDLELAVDTRNAPACKLYRGAGFKPFDRRAVHLARLGPGPGPSPTFRGGDPAALARGG